MSASFYPGPAYAAPEVHFTTECLHHQGWHDIAGALSFQGTHHVFQGCPYTGARGWAHTSSTDLVHWKDHGQSGPVALNETYAGMESSFSPCAGFVAIDDEGTPCAGFRQCISTKGTTALNPQASTWDVPIELRCATNEQLTSWSAPQYIVPVYYYRALPYDPVRPWKDLDGKWYLLLATDACNATTQAAPVPATTCLRPSPQPIPSLDTAPT